MYIYMYTPEYEIEYVENSFDWREGDGKQEKREREKKNGIYIYICNAYNFFKNKKIKKNLNIINQ